MEPLRFFQSVQYLQPKCSKCGSRVEYGVTTDWDAKRETQVCSSCGSTV